MTKILIISYCMQTNLNSDVQYNRNPVPREILITSHYISGNPDPRFCYYGDVVPIEILLTKLENMELDADGQFYMKNP